MRRLILLAALLSLLHPWALAADPAEALLEKAGLSDLEALSESLGGPDVRQVVLAALSERPVRVTVKVKVWLASAAASEMTSLETVSSPVLRVLVKEARWVLPFTMAPVSPCLEVMKPSTPSSMTV
jgi:hypothetical protein